MKLIDMSSEYLSLLDEFEYVSACTEDKEYLQEYLTAKLEAIDELIEHKLNKLGYVIKDYQYDIEKFDNEIKRLKERKARAERNLDSLKDYVSFCLQGQKRQTENFKFSFLKSESVEIVGDLPEQYQRVKTVIEPDKAKIKEDLKIGANLEFAKLVTKNNLQIK